MKISTFIIAIAASLFASVALAAPVVWTITGANLASGKLITGSFTYDADTNTYSNINISTTGGVGPFTLIYPSPGPSATGGYFIQSPASPGQNGIVMFSAAKTNAGGTLTITTGASQGGLFTCTGVCTSGSFTVGEHFTSGTIVGVPAAAVPTLSQWAMILTGLLLAGFARIQIRQSRAARA